MLDVVEKIARSEIFASAEMSVSQFGHFPAARSSFQESLLDKERFVDLLDGAGIFADSRSDCSEPDGAPLEFIYDCEENPVVDFIEAISVDVESFECVASDSDVDSSGALHHCKIADSA